MKLSRYSTLQPSFILGLQPGIPPTGGTQAYQSGKPMADATHCSHALVINAASA
jgi:hypothetical protein